MSYIVTVAAMLAAISLTIVTTAEQLTVKKCYPGSCNDDNCFVGTRYTLGQCERKGDFNRYKIASLNNTTNEWTVRSYTTANCTGYVQSTETGVMGECHVTEYSSARVNDDLSEVTVCEKSGGCENYCDRVSVSASSGKCKKVNPKSISSNYYTAQRKGDAVEFRLHPSPECEGTRYFEGTLTPQKGCVSFKKEATIASGGAASIPLLAAFLTVLVSIVWSG